MDVLDQLVAQGGVALRSELRCRGTELAELVSQGLVRAHGASWVALARTAPGVVAARRLRASISCVSAAGLYDLALLTPPDCVHLAVPRRRGVRPGPVRVHRETLWTRPGGLLPLAPPEEVLARVLRCQPTTAAVVTTDSALNRALVTVEQLSALLGGPGSRRARGALDRCNPRSRSAIETLARLALEDAGLSVSAGVVIGGVGEVDLLVEGRVVVECDGFAYHSGREQYRKDRWRDRELVARGMLVLRFTWEEIMNEPGAVVDAVRAALAGHVPQAQH